MLGLELCGYLAGVCTAVCFLPQTIRVIRTRDVQSLSLPSYLIYAVGLMCWIIYGNYLHSLQMIIFNVIALTFALIITGMIVVERYYGRGDKK